MRLIFISKSFFDSAEFANFVLGSCDGVEIEGQDAGHKLRNMLIQRIDHLSDQVNYEKYLCYNVNLFL